MYMCSCLSCILILNFTDTLDLGNNNLMGTIPTEIGLLTYWVSLVVASYCRLFVQACMCAHACLAF